jgi:hypothetical protein
MFHCIDMACQKSSEFNFMRLLSFFVFSWTVISWDVHYEEIILGGLKESNIMFLRYYSKLFPLF